MIDELTKSLIQDSRSILEGKKLDPVGKADKDIDNDGDVDDSDEYLHKKRKAISKAVAKDEAACPSKKKKEEGKAEKVEINPKLDEEKMTDAQMKKREDIVLGMKDQIPEFKKKYGDRWEDVMYATATKLAMKK